MTKTKRPFAAVMQAILIISLLTSFVLIAQQFSLKIYQIGLLLLVISTFLQIGFGNIPPTAGFKQSAKMVAITLVIIAAIFALGIILTPYLLQLGRR